MTFVKMAASPEELYEVEEPYESVVATLHDGASWITLSVETDRTALEPICLNASRIEAVWPS